MSFLGRIESFISAAIVGRISSNENSVSDSQSQPSSTAVNGKRKGGYDSCYRNSLDPKNNPNKAAKVAVQVIDLTNGVSNQGSRGMDGTTPPATTVAPLSPVSSSSSSSRLIFGPDQQLKLTDDLIEALEIYRDKQIKDLKTKKQLFSLPNNLNGADFGLENSQNSCTIASLLFSLFAASDFYDRLFLVQNERDCKEAIEIKNELRIVAKYLRSNTPTVPQKFLTSIRQKVLREEVMGDFLQPDEFINPLLQILSQNSYNLEEEICQVGLMGDLLEGSDLSSFDPISLQALIGYQERKYRSLVESKYNKVLIINRPIQAGLPGVEEHGYQSAYQYVLPSLEINLSCADGSEQKYRLQSILTNEGRGNHYSSWVNFSSNIPCHEGMYYFNGGGTGEKGSRPESFKVDGVFEKINSGCFNEADESTENQNYKKLLEEGATYIYTRVK